MASSSWLALGMHSLPMASETLLSLMTISRRCLTLLRKSHWAIIGSDAIALNQEICHLLQCDIADLMAELVVGFPEAVEVGIDEADRTGALFHPADLFNHGVAVVQTRQVVIAAQTVQVPQQIVVRDFRPDEIRERL